jgi:hypothetical protein
MRGLPPFEFLDSGGGSSSTPAHNSSLMMGFAMASDFIDSQLTG